PLHCSRADQIASLGARYVATNRVHLRPIVQIDEGKLMSSDINELYRRVIYRNNTLTDLFTTSRSKPGELVMCQEKLVQEAVDTFLDNGIHRQPIKDGHQKINRSLQNGIYITHPGSSKSCSAPISRYKRINVESPKTNDQFTHSKQFTRMIVFNRIYHFLLQSPKRVVDTAVRTSNVGYLMLKFNEDLVHPTRTRHGHPAFFMLSGLVCNY
ncbi:hypothetical protein ES319_D08G252900v1, partial [Gossypium barbadense]